MVLNPCAQKFSQKQNLAAIDSFRNNIVLPIDVIKLLKITRLLAIAYEGFDGLSGKQFNNGLDENFGFINELVKVKLGLLDTDIGTACN